MITSVFSALFLPRLGSALRLGAGILVLTGYSASNAQSAEPPHLVAERGVERFALLCLAHMGQPEGTAAAARQAGLASLSGDVLRRHDATQGWSTTVGDRRASIFLHPDGNCSLLIDSLPLPFAFKAVEGKLSALSAGERLRGGKIGRDYALRYRNLPAMVSVAGSPGSESGEVSLKTLASELPGQRTGQAPPPPIATPSTPSVTAPATAATVPPVATASPSPAPVGAAPAPSVAVNPTIPGPFPPVATASPSTPPQLSAPVTSSPSTLTPKVEAGSPPVPFPPPGNSAPASQVPTIQTPATQPSNPSSAITNQSVTSAPVSSPMPVQSPQSPPALSTPSSPSSNVAELPVPNLPLFPTAPAAPSLSPDLLPPQPSTTPLTPVDPDKPIAEASLVALFADSCLTTKGSYAALQAKADAQGWRAMLPAAARDGFDFSWLIVPGKGVRLGLFLDSLRQKCCVSAFPADPSLIRQSIDARLSLGTPTSQVSKLKEVYVYPTKNGLTVSADFERAEPNAVFANVCSRPKLP